jgi:hypothetical protein
LRELADLCRAEQWATGHATDAPLDILATHLAWTWERVLEEGKVARDGSRALFHTGLFNLHLQPLYGLCTTDGDGRPALTSWVRAADPLVAGLPVSQATPAYFLTDPAAAVFDSRRPVVWNLEYLASQTAAAAAEPAHVSEHQQLLVLRSALENAVQAAGANWRLALPRPVRDSDGTLQVELVLPLCLDRPGVADVGVALSLDGARYIAHTVLPMAQVRCQTRVLTPLAPDWRADAMCPQP